MPLFLPNGLYHFWESYVQFCFTPQSAYIWKNFFGITAMCIVDLLILHCHIAKIKHNYDIVDFSESLY